MQRRLMLLTIQSNAHVGVPIRWMPCASVGVVAAAVLDVLVFFIFVSFTPQRHKITRVAEIRLFGAALSATLFTEQVDVVFLAVVAAVEPCQLIQSPGAPLSTWIFQHAVVGLRVAKDSLVCVRRGGVGGGHACRQSTPRFQAVYTLRGHVYVMHPSYLVVAHLALAIDDIDVVLSLVLAAIQRERRVNEAEDGLLGAGRFSTLAAQQIHHASLSVRPATAAGLTRKAVCAAVAALRGGAVAKVAQVADEVDVMRGLVQRAGDAAARPGRTI